MLVVELDYVGFQVTLHWRTGAQRQRLLKAEELSLVKQIMDYEKQYGQHPHSLTYYGNSHALLCTKAADLWLIGVWLANTPERKA